MNPRTLGSKEELQAEHRALDLRLRRLEKRPYLTGAEELEARELKKLKLRTKDALNALVHRD